MQECGAAWSTCWHFTFKRIVLIIRFAYHHRFLVTENRVAA